MKLEVAFETLNKMCKITNASFCNFDTDAFGTTFAHVNFVYEDGVREKISIEFGKRLRPVRFLGTPDMCRHGYVPNPANRKTVVECLAAIAKYDIQWA